MAEQKQGEPQSFWVTLPGILTSAGTLVVAITGLIIALNPATAPAPAPIVTDTAPYFLTRRVTPADLTGISARNLELMRNEIFARHGRKFARADLQDYFKTFPWYHPQYALDAFPANLLTPIQQQNVALIQEAERLTRR